MFIGVNVRKDLREFPFRDDTDENVGGASAHRGMYCKCEACDRPRGGWAVSSPGIW